MIAFFNRLFNIRTYEWPRLLFLYAMLFILVLGTGWGTAIVEAAFLEQVGVEFLPWVFIAIAVISIPANALYTAFADRIANDKLLVAILGVGMVGIILGIGLLWLDIPLAYPFLYLLIYVPLADILVIHWFTYVNGFYDTRAAKRIIPVIVTSPRVAGIIAGLTMPFINRILPPTGIILLWAAACGIMGGLVWLMPRLRQILPPAAALQSHSQREARTKRASVLKPGEHPPSYLNNLREGYQYVIQSKFLRWMALSTFLFTLLAAFLNVQASQIFYDDLRTMEKISNFIGILNGVSNLILLPLLLFGLSRIINAIGLGNANLIYPAGTFIISSSLVAWPELPTAALAYFSRNALVASIRNPIDSLLYNAVPLRIKGRARAFIGGLVVPIGSLVGNGILLILKSDSLSETSRLQIYTQGIILLSALGFLISALFIRKQYAQALVKMLEQEDYSFLLSQHTSDLTIVDPAALESLRKRLQAHIRRPHPAKAIPDGDTRASSHEMTVFLAQLISQVGEREAFPILEEAARTAPEARTRAALIDILALADIREKAVHQLYIDALDDPKGSVRQSAIIALEQTARVTHDSQAQLDELRGQMLRMTQDSDLDVRVQALSVLTRIAPDTLSYAPHQSAPDQSDANPAAQMLAQLLTAENPRHRARGVQILGQIPDTAVGQPQGVAPTKERLLTYLTDPADEVRLQAMIALENLTDGKLSTALKNLLEEQVSQRLQDPVERIRQGAITILGRIGTRTAHTVMLDALTDTSPQVRTTAVDTLAQVGKSIVPLIHPKLEAPLIHSKVQDPYATGTARSVQKMATTILCRVSPREFGGLIQANVMGNLLHIYRNYGYVAALMPPLKMPKPMSLPSVSVLQSALIEQNQQLVEEIFYLLSAIHDPGAVKIIHESLQPQGLSTNEASRVRANATESLESLTTPQIATLIAQATQIPRTQDNHGLSEGAHQSLLALGQDAWDMQPPDIGEALRQLMADPDSAWLRAIATFAVGEMGTQIRQRQATMSSKLDKERVGSPTRPRRQGRRRRNPLLDKLTEKLVDTTPANHRSDSSGSETEVEAQSLPFALSEIERMLAEALTDPAEEVRQAAQATLATKEEKALLSTIEKIIFLKEVPFFQSMTVDQLRVLAAVCEEEFFEEDTRIFNEGDPGGVLYVVVQGRVGIEQATRRKGSFARLATIEAHSYFGEMNLFDNSPRTASAIAIQDTLTLRLRREPLIALARQHPNLSLELINVLSARLREAQDAIAERTRTKPRELQKLYDQFR